MEVFFFFFFYAFFVVATLNSTAAIRLPLGVKVGHPSMTTDDAMVVIGDMALPERLHKYLKSPQHTRKIIAAPEYMWPVENGFPTIPFTMDYYASRYYRAEIEAGMDHWEQHTCIRFREKTDDDIDYVQFMRGMGCWSYVGRIKGMQQISIGNGCQTLGIIVHEIGHAVGFIHEQMRPDRDNYLMINLNNVDEDRQTQFTKYSASKYFTYNVEYDYTSVMQYGGTDFSRNGKLTMATLNPEHQGLLGRGQSLSYRDKFVVNTHYGCIAKWEDECNSTQGACENGGYVGKDCKCVCPPGTNGDSCENKSGTYYDSDLPACNKFITEETVITSPNYPLYIQMGSWCVYQIQAPEGKFVKVIFSDFSLAKYSSYWPDRCASAFLEIRDDLRYQGSMFCGNDIESQQSFISSSRSMILYLDVPYASNSKGFKASVFFVDEMDRNATITEESIL